MVQFPQIRSDSKERSAHCNERKHCKSPFFNGHVNGSISTQATALVMASQQGNYQLFSVMDIDIPGIQWLDPYQYMNDASDPESVCSRAAAVVADLLDPENIEDCKVAIKALKRNKHDIAVIIVLIQDQELYADASLLASLQVAQALFDAGADDVVLPSEVKQFDEPCMLKASKRKTEETVRMVNDDAVLAARDIFLAIELALLRKSKYDILLQTQSSETLKEEKFHSQSSTCSSIHTTPDASPVGMTLGSAGVSKEIEALQQEIEALQVRNDGLEARIQEMMDAEPEPVEMESLEAELQYLYWSWIPNQLHLKLPRIDANLIEEEDGSIGTIRYIKDLGKGAFGQVHLGCTSEGEHVALKVIQKANAETIDSIERAYREIQILTQLPVVDHLVRYLGALHSVDAIYLILSYGGPKNLYTLQCDLPSYRISVATASHIFGQIAGAVAKLHEVSIFHRDIKPENIAMNDEGGTWHATLVDCGMAVKATKLLNNPCGSLPFAAPEIFEEECKYLGGPADAFAVGMLLFEMIRGLFVMHNLLGWSSGEEQASSQRGFELRSLLQKGVPDAGKLSDEPAAMTAIMEGLLQVEPAERWNLPDLLASDIFASIKMMAPITSDLQFQPLDVE